MVMVISFTAACLVIYGLIWSIRTSCGSTDGAAGHGHGGHGSHGGHH